MSSKLTRFGLIVFLILACTAHPCPDGVAWDAGGYRNGQMFLCPAARISGTIYTNPLAPLFPEFVKDC